MTLPPRVRKAVLTTHIVTSVGWLGAVIAYLSLDVIAVSATDPDLVRAAFQAMDVTVSYAIVPLALASVTVGVINALGTHWGLVRHYWVLVKLLLTLFATTILLIETQTVSHLAHLAADDPDPGRLPGTLGHSIGGIIVLTTAAILSVYKPRGLTRYGWRKQRGG